MAMHVGSMAACLGCSSSCGGNTPLAPDAGLVAVTFNAGLTELFVEHTGERAPQVAAALAELDADVVCLQEVWSEEHVTQIREATRDRFATALVLEPRQEWVPGACEAEALEPLAACVVRACADPPDAGCIIEQCGEEFAAQEGACGLCLASSLGGTTSEIVEACTTVSPRYQYDGSFGLMLLSRRPVVDQAHVELEGSLNRRAVLHAELEGDVHAFCTHLTAVEPLPYPGSGGSWRAEQADQIQALLAYIDERAPTSSPTLLMGDLNVGPHGSGFTAEQPDAYEAIVARGFETSFGDACTLCSDNPLVGAETPSVLIDHVLVRGAGASGQRTLDAAVVISGEASRLSDHYGVRATVSR